MPSKQEPASPNMLISEIEDNDYGSSSDDDGSCCSAQEEDYDGEFEPTPTSGTRKRHLDDIQASSSSTAAVGLHHQQQPPQMRADSLQYSTMSPTEQYPHGNNSAELLNASVLSQQTTGPSWYFQNNNGAGQYYNGSFTSAYTPNGTALPPHLAYWMNQQNPPNPYYGGGTTSGGIQYGRDVSDLTYADGRKLSSMGMGTVNEGELGVVHYQHPFNNGQQQQYQHNNNNRKDLSHLLPDEHKYEVYSTRWIMLGYMSLLNLLSDWTCYSVAPIAMLTQETYGDVDPESLVTVFLGANAVASALEPMVLGRLGLRRTVLLRSLLLTLGSIVKSGGLKGILMSSSSSSGGGSLMMSEEEMLAEEDSDISWRLYLGFFLVGLSQPLYQCTPALLSASWFPENERTMATGVALNSNQLGIGCAFVFGTMLVSTEKDIIPYFGLLSLISTITFIGTALQFEDAPPTPPSDSARVIKGDLEIKIPKFIPFIGGYGRQSTSTTPVVDERKKKKDDDDDNAKKKADVAVASGAPSPAPTSDDPVEVTRSSIHDVVEGEMQMQYNSVVGVGAPSPAPMGDEPVQKDEKSPKHKKQKSGEGLPPHDAPAPVHAQPNHPLAAPPPPGAYNMMAPPPPGYYQGPPIIPDPGMGYSSVPPAFYHGYDQQGHYRNALLENQSSFAGYDDYWQSDDEGVEPIMTQLDHQLDIDIRDDQLIQQVKACFRRKGFTHCVVAFTTSGIIVNTLSTFMDYLVTLNGAPHVYVGIVGGTFQALIMCASLLFGGWTDHSRKYYFVILAMLVMGAFALAVCNVDLDSNAGGDLRWNLLVVAVLAGPLQPISTELGYVIFVCVCVNECICLNCYILTNILCTHSYRVEVVYPLSENTVLVIQQLFSNLLSAAFIPVFKALRNVGTTRKLGAMAEVPQYTFSFYMLIIIHAVSTCYFATFNGTYLRYDAEEAKKAKKEEERAKLLSNLHEEHGYGAMN